MALLSGVMTLNAPAFAAPDDTDLGFEAAFHRPFYKKKSFGLVITGTTMVAAATFSYFTAGAGAPPAAAGVSTVASWVAGGGAGSYMAGASIVGGWFGGNAMLGAAVLNGISLGTVGAAGSWASLSAGQKALALASTTATLLDGIAVVANPETNQIEWRVILPVPISLADEQTRKLLETLEEASEDVAKSAADLEATTQKQHPKSPESAEFVAAKQAHEQVLSRYNVKIQKLENELAQVMSSGASNHTTILMAVIAHNTGRSDQFRGLLNSVKDKHLRNRSYLDYLLAIGNLQLGKVTEAEMLLKESGIAAPFAIEPAILMASLAGNPNFKDNEPKINEIVNKAEENFDADKYISSASLVSLHFRVGTMALVAKRCDPALEAFKKAQKWQPIIGKYFTDKDTRNLLEIGEANAMHCQGKPREAWEIFNSAWQRASSEEAKKMLCAQYFGGCAH